MGVLKVRFSARERLVHAYRFGRIYWLCTLALHEIRCLWPHWIQSGVVGRETNPMRACLLDYYCVLQEASGALPVGAQCRTHYAELLVSSCDVLDYGRHFRVQLVQDCSESPCIPCVWITGSAT